MYSQNLTPQQATIMRDRLVPAARLLSKWSGRMIQCDFQPGDRLALATNEALGSVSELVMRLHRIAGPTPLPPSGRPTEGERRSRKNA